MAPEVVLNNLYDETADVYRQEDCAADLHNALTTILRLAQGRLSWPGPLFIGRAKKRPPDPPFALPRAAPSFGVMLWQMCAQEQPFSQSTELQVPACCLLSPFLCPCRVEMTLAPCNSFT